MHQKKLSGLQLQVLSLYRSVLRSAVRKDLQQQNSNDKALSFMYLLCNGRTSMHARAEFRRDAKSIRRSDFQLIEYKLRKGTKYVKMLDMDGVKVAGGSV
mmetsp:Transcript_7684/g.9471  ORF Transcript_7684/g.9471 Transcript_7684/m.9471 type:complete len:100 (+) Transcript_7684:221-520(+)